MEHQCEKSNIEINSSKVEALIKATFHRKCVDHVQKNYLLNYFCWDCRELKPLCEICKETSHSNHTVKQVFKASRTSAVRVEDVKKLFEITETQPHVNNSQLVLYFYKRALEDDVKTKPVHTGKSRCQNCGYEMSKDGYKFCSLQCQSQCLGKRKNVVKRRRKGIPFRAPFF